MKKSGNKRMRRTIFWVVTVLMLVIGIACFAVTDMLNSIDRGDEELNHEELDTHEGLSEEIINIAVFGVDSRDDTIEGRSDAMMIVSVDMKNNKIKAVSLMRDSLVKIEGHGKYKLNSAYARGGVELAIKTINQNFDMNITDYVSVNFKQLAGIVDALGGVEVEITEAERRNANKYIKEMAKEHDVEAELIEESGVVTLRGFQAVAYTRIRAVGNADFQRTERQREVMQKLMDKALDVNPMRYLSLVKSLIPMIETSLSNDEIVKLAGVILLKGRPEFEQGRFPIDGSYKTNSSYAMVYDLDEAAAKLHRFIYEDEPFYEETESEIE